MARHPFCLMFAAVLASCLAAEACAVDVYPSRPVHWVVPYPPGGGAEFIVRLVGQRLSERLGQPFLIENKAGAGANIGTEAVVRSAADGYTLLFVSTANAINASLYKNLPFNFRRDIAPVAGLVRLPLVMVVHPSFPAQTVEEFIAYAKTKPVNMASSGVGTSFHLAGEMFRAMTGVHLLHVPYRGAGPAMTDLLAGHVDVMFDNISTSIEHIRAGKLRVLGIAASARSEVLPEAPPIGDTVPGYEAASLFGMGAPRETPAAIIDVLNREVNSALRDPAISTRLVERGATVLVGSSADFAALLERETERWAQAVRSSGASLP